ncbi:hypothetical protein TSUD_155920 [Trifolium subterraneum]|uniref:Reverse transcriptase zinc-binding domain-containing protein n=1 Tax=Trifolium subterraneum TaxID=3900 RepID=A0A2Z6P062_TRISU|nr:hypothetical protein TSUD_155920 [Trifolium subterraneum]
MVGSGDETFFWSDQWLGGVPLSGVGGVAWLWRRQLWAWEEEMLEECRTLLSDIVLQPNVADQWLWRPTRVVVNLCGARTPCSILGTIMLWRPHQTGTFEGVHGGLAVTSKQVTD